MLDERRHATRLLESGRKGSPEATGNWGGHRGYEHRRRPCKPHLGCQEQAGGGAPRRLSAGGKCLSKISVRVRWRQTAKRAPVRGVSLSRTRSLPVTRQPAMVTQRRHSEQRDSDSVSHRDGHELVAQAVTPTHSQCKRPMPPAVASFSS